MLAGVFYVMLFMAQLPDKQPELVGKQQPVTPVVLHGVVREAGVRKPLGQIGIALNGVFVTTTDDQGEFSLINVLPGSYQLTLKHPLFELFEVTETINKNERLEVIYYLRRRLTNPFETVVRSQKDRREVTVIELEREELRKVPGTFGDPIRVIENLPGMGLANGGLGGQLLVRGASPADTQVLIDGMPIPILYHFFGLISVVNAESIERIDFYPGGFGARYGRAIAGVVDVSTRDLNCDILHGSAKIDILDAAGYVCAPAGEWLVSVAARRSYVDVILGWVIDALPKTPGSGALLVSPLYDDYQAKAQVRLGRHRLSIAAFGSQDNLRVLRSQSLTSINFNAQLSQSFHRLSLRDRYAISSDVTLTSTLSPAYIPYSAGASVAGAGSGSTFDLDVYSLDWREDLRWQVHPKLIVFLGLDHTLQSASIHIQAPTPGYQETFPTPIFDYTQVQRYSESDTYLDQAYWSEWLWKINESWQIVPGLRLENLAQNHTTALELMPRLTTRWQVLPQTVLKAAYGVYTEMPAPQALSNSVGNAKLKAQRAMHYVAGVEQQLPWSIHVDLSGFYNRYSDLAVNSNTTLFVNNQYRPEFYSSSGVGRAYGLELLLRRMPSPNTTFYGWVAYTLSRSERQDHAAGSTYIDVNTPNFYDATATQTYLSPYDQTHILTVIGQWLLPHNWETGLRFRYVSGNPYTPLEREQAVLDTDLDAYTLDTQNVPKNSARLPAFVELDLRVDKTFVYNLFKIDVYLELVNATNAKNVESYTYDYRYRQKAAFSLLPILPVLGVKATF